MAAWGFLGWVDAIAGDLDGAARRAETTVQLAHEIRLPASGAVEAALDVIAEALEQRRETDERAFVATLLSLRGLALARRERRRPHGSRCGRPSRSRTVRAPRCSPCTRRRSCAAWRRRDDHLQLERFQSLRS